MTATPTASETWFEQAGLILFTENYEACIAFYRDMLGLPQLFSKRALTVLAFGNGYLMIETDGIAQPGEKSFSQNPVTLRFNVADVEEIAGMLRKRGIKVSVQNWEWGVTGLMLDPDGNRVELKDHFDGFFASSSRISGKL